MNKPKYRYEVLFEVDDKHNWPNEEDVSLAYSEYIQDKSHEKLFQIYTEKHPRTGKPVATVVGTNDLKIAQNFLRMADDKWSMAAQLDKDATSNHESKAKQLLNLVEANFYIMEYPDKKSNKGRR